MYVRCGVLHGFFLKGCQFGEIESAICRVEKMLKT